MTEEDNWLEMLTCELYWMTRFPRRHPLETLVGLSNRLRADGLRPAEEYVP